MWSYLPIIGPLPLFTFGAGGYHIYKTLYGRTRLSANTSGLVFFVSPFLIVLAVLAAGYIRVGSINSVVVNSAVGATVILNLVLLFFLGRRSGGHPLRHWGGWKKPSRKRFAASAVFALSIAYLDIAYMVWSLVVDNECHGRCAGIAVLIGNPNYTPFLVWTSCILLGFFFTVGVIALVSLVRLINRKS